MGEDEFANLAVENEPDVHDFDEDHDLHIEEYDWYLSRGPGFSSHHYRQLSL